MGNVDDKISGKPAKNITRAERKKQIEARWSEKPGYCTADTKAGGRCGQHARDGFFVCAVHGAGSAKRERAGERKPAGFPVKNGLYSRRVRENAAVATSITEYERAGDQLYKMDTIAARTWVALEHADRAVALVLQYVRRAEERAATCNSEEEESRAGSAVRLFGTVLDRVQIVIGRLESIAATRHKMQTGDGGISRLEMVAVLRLVGAWVREIAADDDVPRERIAEELIQRVQAYAAGQQSPPAPH